MFTRENVVKVIDELKKKYPCFVSERHLQTSFTITAAELFKKQGFEFIPEFSPDTTSIPEYLRHRYDFNGNEISKRDIHLDLLIKSPDNNNTIIEFKYKTSQCITTVNGMEVNLGSHEDITNGRYAVWADICRIEKFVLDNNNKLNIHNGFSVLITNHKSYLAEPRANTLSAPFSLHKDSGRKKKWPRNSEQSVIRENQSPLDFSRDYVLKEEYYNAALGFKMLIVEIK